jgi:hypothetical protein
MYFILMCHFPVSGDWYCDEKGSCKIPCLATPGENGLGGIGYLRQDVTARESVVTVKLILHYLQKLSKYRRGCFCFSRCCISEDTKWIPMKYFIEMCAPKVVKRA